MSTNSWLWDMDGHCLDINKSSWLVGGISRGTPITPEFVMDAAHRNAAEANAGGWTAEEWGSPTYCELADIIDWVREHGGVCVWRSEHHDDWMCEGVRESCEERDLALWHNVSP